MKNTLSKYLKLLLSFSLFILLFTLFNSPVHAATYYVAGDTGLDTYTSAQATSSATPWKTIQKAANTMVAGDTVNVKGGITYSGTITLAHSGVSGSPIVYQAWSGTGIPIVTSSDGNGFAGSSESYISISGFIIKNCTDNGIFLLSYATIYNNIIYNNFHAGIKMGGGSSSVIVSNTVYRNGSDGINIGFGGNGLVENNIIVGQQSWGIVSNTSFFSGTYDHNLVYANTGLIGYPSYGTDYMTINGWSAGPHDVNSDPLFVDPANDNLKLQSSSPAINAGVDLTSSGVTSDILGVARPQGSAFDIGAYEYYGITGESISYQGGNYTPPSTVSLTVSDGTDSVSSLNTSSRIVQRRQANYTDGSCGSYGAYSTISTSGTYPNFTDTLTSSGYCYQYRYLVSDSVGNQFTAVSGDTVITLHSAPSAPSCDSTTPQGRAPWIYAASAKTNTSITLKFTNWQTPVDHFSLEYGTKPGVYQYGATNIGPNGTNQYTVNYLSPNTTYYFRVRSYNGCTPGSLSNEIQGRSGGWFSVKMSVPVTSVTTNTNTDKGTTTTKVSPTPKSTTGVSGPTTASIPAVTPEPQVQDQNQSNNIFTKIVSFFKGIFGR